MRTMILSVLVGFLASPGLAWARVPVTTEVDGTTDSGMHVSVNFPVRTLQSGRSVAALICSPAAPLAFVAGQTSVALTPDSESGPCSRTSMFTVGDGDFLDLHVSFGAAGAVDLSVPVERAATFKPNTSRLGPEFTAVSAKGRWVVVDYLDTVNSGEVHSFGPVICSNSIPAPTKIHLSQDPDSQGRDVATQSWASNSPFATQACIASAEFNLGNGMQSGTWTWDITFPDGDRATIRYSVPNH